MPRRYMEAAIKAARKGIRKGNSPFGACIVKDGKIVVAEHNVVLATHDATAHAEITAIRKACEKLKTHELRGCAIYSTTEPCPMCFSAIHWAKIGAIVYGTRIEDVKRLGFSELTISAKEMKRQGRSKVKVKGDFMREENLELLRDWKKGKGRTY